MDLKPIAKRIVENLGIDQLNKYKLKYQKELNDYQHRLENGHQMVTGRRHVLTVEEWFSGFLAVMIMSRLRRLLIMSRNVDFIILEHIESQLLQIECFSEMQELETFVGINNDM